MGRILINCDLGENESAERTEKLLGLVDAASIGCGVHAGSPAKTRETIRASAGRGILIGAHPGLAAAGGRGDELPSPEDFQKIIRDQIEDFIAVAEEFDQSLNYVKLHGSLYHAVEADEAYADRYLEVLCSLFKTPAVFALAGGALVDVAEEAGIRAFAEVFADRAYLSSGGLVSRSETGAVLGSDAALDRFDRWWRSGKMDTIEGDSITLRAETLCVHSDSPESETLLAALRELISFE